MRVQINLSDEMVKRVDTIANSIGVPRATLLSVWVGQYVNQFDTAVTIVNDATNKLLHDAIENAPECK